MNKFKHNFGVKGPVSLLNALKEEAIKAGWELVSRPTVGNIYFNGNRKDCFLDPGQFWMSDHAETDIILPKDWNKAVKMLSEKEEEYTKGEWMYFKHHTDDDYGIFRYHSTVGNVFTTEESYHIIGSGVYCDETYNSYYASAGGNFEVSKATREQVEEVLIKVAKNKGFTPGTLFTAVREMKELEIWKADKRMESSNEICPVNDGKTGSFFYYNDETNVLTTWGYGAFVVYEKGIWATLRTEEKPPLAFGGRHVEVFDDGRVVFSPVYHSRVDEIEAIYNWHHPLLSVAGYPFKPREDARANQNLPVTIGCTTGTLGELKAILDRYKEISSSITAKN